MNVSEKIKALNMTGAQIALVQLYQHGLKHKYSGENRKKNARKPPSLEEYFKSAGIDGSDAYLSEPDPLVPLRARFCQIAVDIPDTEIELALRVGKLCHERADMIRMIKAEARLKVRQNGHRHQDRETEQDFER